MKKIPTLFKRDFEGSSGRYVLPEVTPGCEWVLAGEGSATRKYDGTCVLVDESGGVWARREVKAGKEPPPDFWPIETDDTTGKTVGWEPAGNSGYAKYVEEAEAAQPDIVSGTYELCGPKVQGNPEAFDRHVLVSHADAIVLTNAPRTFDELAAYLARHSFEGIVWHHPDGRMAKLKKRDFPAPTATAREGGASE